MIAIEVRGVERLEGSLARLEVELDRAQERAVAAGSVIVREKLVERMSDPGGSHPFFGRTGGAGDTLAARSGQSRARLTPAGQTVRAGDSVFATVGSPDPHVAFLEEGGTINGRPYLSVPLAANQTAQGVDRGRLPGGFIIRSKAGNLFVARRKGRNGLELLRMLLRQVTIRGRHVFARARAEAEPEIARRAEAEVNLAVRRANG